MYPFWFSTASSALKCLSHSILTTIRLQLRELEHHGDADSTGFRFGRVQLASLLPVAASAATFIAYTYSSCGECCMIQNGEGTHPTSVSLFWRRHERGWRLAVGRGQNLRTRCRPSSTHLQRLAVDQSWKGGQCRVCGGLLLTKTWYWLAFSNSRSLRSCFSSVMMG